MDVPAICAHAQSAVLDAIPPGWRIDASLCDSITDVRSIPARCGILTSSQLAITSLSTTRLLRQIHSGELTALDVTEAYCARAAVAHQLVNCLIEFFPAEAMERARAMDEEFAEAKREGRLGALGKLWGLPIAVKDMYETKDHLSTFGYVSWYGYRSDRDASLVNVMKDAGVVIFGKTTMPQTGMALETRSNLFGRTLNPFNTNFAAGGSSGGDAVLVAMRGAPCSPLSSDIGGSIRVPAAFNGLYAMRPSSDRVPKMGVMSTAPGQGSIKVSCGPIGWGMGDLKMLVREILVHEAVPFETTCVPGRWNEVADMSGRRLKVGVMKDDGVVRLHPPLLRAIEESAEKLRIGGHETVDLAPPLDMWEVAQTTFSLYWQTGAAEIKAAIAKSGESTLSTFQHNFDIFKTRSLTAQEVYKLNVKQAAYKAIFAEYWTSTGIDVLLCPCAPAAGAPHGFPLWWGYTSVWNILDLPSVVLPVKGFKISSHTDRRIVDYQPRENPFDKDNWELYDPELWSNQPMALQFVGRQCRDEELIARCEIIDQVINGKEIGQAIAHED